MDNKLYTILIYSENVVGILNLVTAVFTRLQVNIESLNVSPSGIPNVHKYTLTIFSNPVQVKKLVKQIEKKVDVIKADYYLNDEIFTSEVALFKLSAPIVLGCPEISKLIRHSGAIMMEANETYITVHICNSSGNIIQLYKALAAFKCILQYTRSGPIAITRAKEEKVSAFLAEQQNAQLRFMEEGINNEFSEDPSITAV
ncbi:MAG: acetolactate synthase small subunit [Bacteroidaceae bacterium]|nr:acetolactate synthase small subunit [Bacteroidaceae bacterium]